MFGQQVDSVRLSKCYFNIHYIYVQDSKDGLGENATGRSSFIEDHAM